MTGPLFPAYGRWPLRMRALFQQANDGKASQDELREMLQLAYMLGAKDQRDLNRGEGSKLGG